MVVTTYVVIFPTMSGVPGLDPEEQPPRCVFIPTASGAQALAADIPGATYHSWDLSDAL